MSTTDSPAPILAVAQKPAQPERSFLKKPQVKLLALLDLQDPGNVGTLIRAACAFGLQGLIMVGQAVDPFHPKIIRSSAGMIFKLPVLSEPNVSSLFSTLDTYGPFQIWAADAHQGQSYKHTNFGTKWVLLMGSEAHGIPQDAWDKAQAIHIPSEPQVESLNVAVAGAILMAEAYQQERPLSPR
jgi:TrmH family RNA methyltransferase